MVPYVIMEIQIIAINIHQTLQQTSQGDEVDYVAYMEIKNSFLPENLKWKTFWRSHMSWMNVNIYSEFPKRRERGGERGLFTWDVIPWSIRELFSDS